MIFEVGKFYKVPCVYARWYEHTGWWPVLGQFHEDAEHIGFPHLHYHIDVRFLSQSQFDRARVYRRDLREAVVGSPVMIPADWERGGQSRFTKTNRPKRELRDRKCHRQHVRLKIMDAAPWQLKLESAYCNTKLAKGHCPHRGADLSTHPVDRFGCIECPLHGLVFKADTGEMVPRMQWMKWHTDALSNTGTTV